MLRVRVACALLLLNFPFATPAQKRISLHVVKVKLEAPQWDSTLLLEKLNEHAKGHGLRFEVSDTEYIYRIVFGVEQKPVAVYGSTTNASTAVADVFDAKGTELFKIERAGRWSDKGATNAVAKEVIKRILSLRSQPLK